jgi:LPS export ABC transporter protein LptC
MKDERASFLAAFAIACFLVQGCTDLTKPPPGEPPPGEMPEQELFDATIRFFQDDALSSVLHAGRIRKYQKQSVILLDSNIVVDFYNPEGKHTISLWADSGRVDESRKDLKAMGNVVAKSDSGQMLETDLLRWENRSRRIISDAPVKLSTPSDTIYGTGFVSDEHLKNWHVEQPTGTTFRELLKQGERKTRPEAQKPFVPDSVAKGGMKDGG